MNENLKVWESKFLGKFNENGNTFVNKNNELQFKIEIISDCPEDFPVNTRSVSGFGEELRKYGFIDSINKTENERIDELKRFLTDIYFIFSVRESSHSDPEIQNIYYNSYDIEIEKAEKIDNMSSNFIPIPVFSSDSEDINWMFEKVSNQEFIGKNEAISTQKNDYPPFIIIEEIIENKNRKYHLLGPFNEVLHREEYGIKFLSDTSIRKITLSEQDIKGIYLLNHDVMFMESALVYDLERELETDKAQEIPSIYTPTTSQKIEDTDELEFLKDFENVCKSKGLVYEPQDLYNFHTAIKTQSFVILAGMSGTGKSKLVECYFEALNYHGKNKEMTSEEAKRMLFIPVRPFWQDDSDILGYLDTLNGIYRPGDSGLIDFILESNKEENKKECYIVCLDEMNLARVEHYFSQFLSILEREPENRVIQLYNPTLHGRVYNENQYPSQLVLGENLFFIGTINLDESTYQFTDKVLDRANVINLSLMEFTKIKKMLLEYENGDKEKNAGDNSRLERHTFSKFNGMKKESQLKGFNDSEMIFLWELHKMINDINPNIGIGMRIVNQIEQYLMNLPESDVLNKNEAIDLQINQRILTKLRGSESQLIKLVREEAEGVEKGEILRLFDTYKNISKFKISRKKISQISMELTEYGHTL